MRRLLIVGLVAAGFTAGVYVGVTMTSSRPAPASTAMSEAAPSPSDAAAPPPSVEARTTGSAPAPADRAASRREPAVKNAAAPAPAPEPVASAPAVGILNIESDVPGAQVFIDRQFIGAAPISRYEIKPGSHRVNVSATGYEGVVETIDVVPGPRDVVIKLREVRLDASLEVIHRHRMGSCNGRLVATPGGLRYETSDKDDGFTSALLDLENFEVDYLKKNLKIKLKKGKSFDFTDPDGDPDRLFVFHRDVEHARERLKKGDPPAAQ